MSGSRMSFVIVKTVMPGRVRGDWVTSVILGVVDAIAGGWIGDRLFKKDQMSFWSLGPWRLSIIGGLVVAGLYWATTGRNKSNVK